MGASGSDGSKVLRAPSTAFENGGLETRRVLLFVSFAFAISWAIGVIVYATGGIGPESPSVLPGVPLWVLLVAAGYMFGPALANVCTRIVTGEGRAGLRLRPRFRRDWRWWAIAWLLPIALIYLGTALFFAFFPEYFDSSLSAVTQFPGATGASMGRAPTNRRPLPSLPETGSRRSTRSRSTPERTRKRAPYRGRSTQSGGATRWPTSASRDGSAAGGGGQRGPRR